MSTVAVHGHSVTIDMRALSMAAMFEAVADRQDQFAANVVFHVFEHYPSVSRVSVRVHRSAANEYGEYHDVTALRLDATRAVFARLRASGDFSHGPLNIVFGRAALDRVFALFHARR